MFQDRTSNKLKLIDFGSACFDNVFQRNKLIQKPVGWLNYSAPEMLHHAVEASLIKPAWSKRYNTAGYDNSCDVSAHSPTLGSEVWLPWTRAPGGEYLNFSFLHSHTVMEPRCGVVRTIHRLHSV